ncbi:LysR family transcriptional regulator [Loigolactobacillus coryniformis]|nr:LysR family transcriptional regulator [Loigolactobacillus coryniformis]
MENYLLEELVTFAATGTLAKTAQQLNVTQPTVTRGM